MFARVVAWADYQTRPERLKNADISHVAVPCRAMAASSRLSSFWVERIWLTSQPRTKVICRHGGIRSKRLIQRNDHWSGQRA